MIHVVEGEPPSEGTDVTGSIDWTRRFSLMRHHAATHLIAGSSRKVLGRHVWQAGAQKGVEKSRLDISHWAKITPKEATEWEN